MTNVTDMVVNGVALDGVVGKVEKVLGVEGWMDDLDGEAGYSPAARHVVSLAVPRMFFQLLEPYPEVGGEAAFGARYSSGARIENARARIRTVEPLDDGFSLTLEIRGDEVTPPSSERFR